MWVVPCGAHVGSRSHFSSHPARGRVTRTVVPPPTTITRVSGNRFPGTAPGARTLASFDPASLWIPDGRFPCATIATVVPIGCRCWVPRTIPDHLRPVNPRIWVTRRHSRGRHLSGGTIRGRGGPVRPDPGPRLRGAIEILRVARGVGRDGASGHLHGLVAMGERDRCGTGSSGATTWMRSR